MKIAVIGRGNAGSISAAHFHGYGKFIDEPLEVELIHDPKIKSVPTGQGTTLDIVNLIDTVFPDSFTKLPHTKKRGIMYENWKNSKEFFHPFNFGTYSIHINPDDMQKFLTENLKINFTLKEEKVIKYDEVDADYIIDCRGKPKSFEGYDKLINPLNCCLLGNAVKKEHDVEWTRAIATPDGWTFYIPLPDKTSIGYLFNSETTPLKKAISNYKKMFEVNDYIHFPFSQYVAKEPIINDRVLLNGNKLFFLEPLEATAMDTYLQTCRYFWDYAINKKISREEANDLILKYIRKIERFILWHYEDGSKYKTKFWEKAGKLSRKNRDKELRDLIKSTKKLTYSETKNPNTFFNTRYAQWGPFGVKVWDKG